MHLFVGTSGYSYKEWKGSFYPEDLPASRMLPYYAERFGTVEINNTFYRMPKRELVEKWRDEVPPGFVFVLKTPQRITHHKRLAGVAEDFAHFVEMARALGERRGPLLVQLPPYSKRDDARLAEFLALVPKDVRVALEFRHASWLDDKVYTLLREHGAALCAADTDDAAEAAPLVATADWGYVRLRRVAYDEAAIVAWHKRIVAQPWLDAFVFFKHEDAGTGPRYAEQLLAAAGRRVAH
jgi:uncharacterized protein YecE (DUF72 family)